MAQYDSQPDMTIDLAKSYSATLQTNHGDISIEFDAVNSPLTVNNFVSLARDGLVVPLSLRTNCRAEAWISSSLAGGSKLARVLMFLHIGWLRGGRGHRDSGRESPLVGHCRPNRPGGASKW